MASSRAYSRSYRSYKSYTIFDAQDSTNSSGPASDGEKAARCLRRAAGEDIGMGAGCTRRSAADRELKGCDNGWWARPGDEATYLFDGTRKVTGVRLVFDSDLHSNKRMPCSYPLKQRWVGVPRRMPRAFYLEALDGQGQWRVVCRSEDEHLRLVKVALDIETAGVRCVQRETRGAERACHVP